MKRNGAGLKNLAVLEARKRLVRSSGLACFSPLGAMLHDPIGQGLFKAYVPAGFLGFDPFVTENFVKLRLKLFIERRVPDQIISAGGVAGHNVFGFRL
jgi:hypothetical protein